MFPSLRNYQRDWVRGDVVAGLTVWAVLVPSALAYATIAGVPPVVGLYAAPAALILYAAFGSSRQLITGPSAAAAALSAAVVGNAVAGNGDQFVTTTAALAICVGLAALIAGVLRLGFLASFISEPVLKGFIVGLSLTIMVGQIPRLFGVETGTGDFFERIWDFLINIDETRWPHAAGRGWVARGAVRASSSGTGDPRARWRPWSWESPPLNSSTSAPTGWRSSAPSTPACLRCPLPDLSLDRFGGLTAAALGVMLVGFAESLGTAKTYAQRDNREIDPNRELIGLGAANLGAGISVGSRSTGACLRRR